MVKYRIHFAQDRMKRGRGDGGKRPARGGRRDHYDDAVLHDTDKKDPVSSRRDYDDDYEERKGYEGTRSRRYDHDRDERDADFDRNAP